MTLHAHLLSRHWIMTTLGILVWSLLVSVAATAPRRVATFAGNGHPGYTGDGGQATEAQLNNPFGIVRGPDGDLYICDTGNHAIRKVDQRGIITTIAGTGQPGYDGDAGPAVRALLNEPYELRFDAKTNLYFVEMRNHVVRRVTYPSGMITTIAGTGQAGFGGDGGPARQAQFKQPHSIQLGPGGTLFVCDIGNHRIRQVHLERHTIETFSGTGARLPTPDGAPIHGTPLNGPRALDFDGHRFLWLALREGNAVYKIDLIEKTIHHVAGTGKQGFTGNGGLARLATLSGPKGISLGPDGNIYLADTESHSIRMINTSTGNLELIAGTGRRGDGPEGDPLHCSMARPHGIFVDAQGAVFIGDSEAHRVRVIR